MNKTNTNSGEIRKDNIKRVLVNFTREDSLGYRLQQCNDTDCVHDTEQDTNLYDTNIQVGKIHYKKYKDPLKNLTSKYMTISELQPVTNKLHVPELMQYTVTDAANTEMCNLPSKFEEETAKKII